MFRLLSFILKIYLFPQQVLFQKKLIDPKNCQEKLLQYLLTNLSASSYGKKFKISTADQYKEFALKIPVVSYENMIPWIEQHRTSSTSALTSQKILMFEKTSGSSGSIKYIPYTPALLQSFNRMFLLWCHDLLVNGPKLNTGKIFMCISPALGIKETAKNGTPIGTETDLDYVNPWLTILLSWFLVLPPKIRKIKNPETYKLVASLYLLAEEHLEIISIWNPSLLEIFLEFIDHHRDELIEIWSKGKFEFEGMAFKIPRPSAKRLKFLAEPRINWNKLWPQLKLISCWSSANAYSGSQRLQSYFPKTLIQGKGLLATEAPLTIPLMKFNQYIPLIDEVFFEFEDIKGTILPLWEIREGNTYSLIISQKAGLYRYRLGDKVTVSGFAKKTPCFYFVARDACSDLVGEKLHEDFVAKSLEIIPQLTNTTKILLPILPTEGKAFYLLICEDCPESLEEVAITLDQVLKSSYHYHYARELNQLAALRINIQKSISLNYLSCAQKWGLDLGNIKSPSLITNPIRAKQFLESFDLIINDIYQNTTNSSDPLTQRLSAIS